MTRAEEWKTWRKENLLSQVDLATVLGITRRTVQWIENGTHQPSYNSQRRFEVLKKRYERNQNAPAI